MEKYKDIDNIKNINYIQVENISDVLKHVFI